MSIPIGWDTCQVHCKAKTALAKPTKNTSAQASNYSPAKSKDDEPIIPDRSLFASRQLVTGLDTLPSVAQCAVHLELLQCFRKLRYQVINSHLLDQAWDIKPVPRIVYTGSYGSKQEKKLKDTTFQERREAKWPTFIELAVARFTQWLQTAGKHLKSEVVESGFQVELPPLDVLMVWHTLLLNPQCFKDCCISFGLETLRALSFPWTSIHEAIDSYDWSYHRNTTVEGNPTFKGLEDNLLECLINNSKQSIPSWIYRRTEKQNVPLTPDEGNVRNTWQKCLENDGALKRTISFMSAAVQRQSSFVDKMDRQLWIRSPAVEGTLERAIERYDKFLRLMKLYPGTIHVPTLDIDLAWHTHQCSAAAYEAYTVKHVGKFVNHDDSIAKSGIASGLEKTKSLFRIRFGRDYVVCNCWDCEAVASEVARKDFVGVEQSEIQAVSKRILDQVEFYRAVELARRKGEMLPSIPACLK